jgi:hypothetical protein
MQASVSLFPADGPDTASSRIRVYQLQRPFEQFGIPIVFGFSMRSKVLFIQKRVTLRILFVALVGRLTGKRVVYDVDDLGSALWYWVAKPLFRVMLRIANHVTTGTCEQQLFLQKKYRIRACSAIPNAIDYFPDGPHRPTLSGCGYLRVIWFGYSGNFRMLEPYIDVLTGISSIRLVVVTDATALPGLQQRYPEIEFHAWTLDSIVPVLQSCALACLMHDSRQADQYKGNNRMISAINYGVPAIVSRTPEYERTAGILGVDDAVFSSGEELVCLVEKYRDEGARMAYLNKAQKKCWELYSPNAVATLFRNVFRS